MNCKHDFQPTLLRGFNPSEKQGCNHGPQTEHLKVWCVKCDLQVDVEYSELSALVPISERIRDIATIH